MKYDDINSPSQLQEFMNNNIKYGFVDNEGKAYGPWNIEEFQEACRTKWQLSNPERLLQVKYGHCWDQVELERDWFSKHGYNFKTLYIWFLLPYDNSYSTHAYLIYEDANKWHYFEHSDSQNRGIHAFDTYEAAINFQKDRFIEQNKKRNPVGKEELKCLHVYEYDKPPYGCSMSEFIDYILENAHEIDINNI